MIDLYLRAANEDDLKTALPFAVTSNGDWMQAGVDWAIDLNIPIWTVKPQYDEEGNTLVSPVRDPHYFANLRCSPAIAALVPQNVQIPAPSTPDRVWA